MKNTYTFRRLLDNRGCYASFDFEVSYNPEGETKLIVNFNADKKWEIPCKAGILIFFDFYSKDYKGQLTVTVNKIDWLPVDTNNIIVLFSSIQGLSDTLDYQIDEMLLDIEKEVFVIPEQRRR